MAPNLLIQQVTECSLSQAVLFGIFKKILKLNQLIDASINHYGSFVQNPHSHQESTSIFSYWSWWEGGYWKECPCVHWTFTILKILALVCVVFFIKWFRWKLVDKLYFQDYFYEMSTFVGLRVEKKSVWWRWVSIIKHWLHQLRKSL